MKPQLCFTGWHVIRCFCLKKKNCSGPLVRPTRAAGTWQAAWPGWLGAMLLTSGVYLSAQQSAPGPQYGYGYGSQNLPAYGAPQYPSPQYRQPQQPQYGQPQYGQPYAEPGYPQQPGYGQQPPAEGQESAPPPLSADQLEQLVAPIALYPDPLLAQILTASTYPAQVAVADQWLKQMQMQGYSSPDQIAAGANAQSWDPSVKALTAFPQVLDMLNQNLQWTSALGNAYFNQPQDVMQTVQVMRQRAENAGSLQSTPQEGVTEDQGQIELAPPSPEVAYVPMYNPWMAYGAPVSPYPGYSFAGGLGSFWGGGMRFGAGIAMVAFERMPWGWLGWGLSWLGHEVLFNRGTYFTNSREVADWGFPRGGPRAYRGWDRGGYEWGRGGYGMAREQGPNGRGFDRGGQPAWRQAPQPGIPFESRREGFPNGYGGNANRGGQWGRNYGAPGYSGAQQSYGRVPPSSGRPQPEARPYGGSEGFERPGYGYSGRAPQAFATRPSQAFASPYRSQGGSFGEGGRGFAEPRSKQPHSGGGFHLFGGGHEHAPKAYSGGGHASSGREHSGGGGHGGSGHSGGGHHHR